MKLKIYMVQNKQGHYYRRRQYYSGSRWTNNPQRASVWTVITEGPSYILRMYPKAKRIDLEVELP